MKEAILIGISAIISAIITHIVNKKKTKAEVKGIELDNTDKAVKIWRDLAEELETKVDSLYEEVQLLKKAYEDKCTNCEYKLIK